MELSSEAIIAIVGVVVNLPAAAIILWRVCRCQSSKHISANHQDTGAPSEPATDIEETIEPTTAPRVDAQPLFTSADVRVLVKLTTNAGQESSSDTTANPTPRPESYPGPTTGLPSDDTDNSSTVTEGSSQISLTAYRQANEGKDIVENIMFIVSTNAPPGAFSGGTSNIGFNIASDEGKKADASGEKKSVNTNTVDLSAECWVSKIHTEVNRDPTISISQAISLSF
ncbi:hypothetical protein FGADI_8476 [Fusarium gaditjirri]|uniref:Uncharacterized protein n=1 Tax=Fusarium gaditjirri TaxID=282569 RepID=A0A8H4WU35_9HYPO|nr:hypothetical protein FGADI_8476 [Fusarium gaditjirri]